MNIRSDETSPHPDSCRGVEDENSSDEEMMTEEHRRILQSKRSVLASSMTPEEIVSQLHEKRLLTKLEVDTISRKETRQARAEELLDILERRPDRAFKELGIALKRTYQPHLAKLLRPTPSPAPRDISGASSVREASQPPTPASRSTPQSTGSSTPDPMLSSDTKRKRPGEVRFRAALEELSSDDDGASYRYRSTPRNAGPRGGVPDDDMFSPSKRRRKLQQMESEILDVATAAISNLKRYSATPESLRKEMKKTSKALKELKRTYTGLRALFEDGRSISRLDFGSIIFTFLCPTDKSVDSLMQLYGSGRFASILNSTFVTAERCARYGFSRGSVRLRVYHLRDGATSHQHVDSASSDSFDQCPSRETNNGVAWSIKISNTKRPLKTTLTPRRPVTRKLTQERANLKSKTFVVSSSESSVNDEQCTVLRRPSKNDTYVLPTDGSKVQSHDGSDTNVLEDLNLSFSEDQESHIVVAPEPVDGMAASKLQTSKKTNLQPTTSKSVTMGKQPCSSLLKTSYSTRLSVYSDHVDDCAIEARLDVNVLAGDSTSSSSGRGSQNSPTWSSINNTSDSALSMSDSELDRAVLDSDIVSTNVTFRKALSPLQPGQVRHTARLAKSAPCSPQKLYPCPYTCDCCRTSTAKVAGVDCSRKDQSGNTPVHLAALSNCPDVLESLLEMKLDINARNDDGSTALHVACARGLERVVRRLLLLGANAHVRDSSGATPLHLASAADHHDIVKLLLSHGASVIAMDEMGRTPADMSHRLSVIHLLNGDSDSQHKKCALSSIASTPLSYRTKKRLNRMIRL